MPESVLKLKWGVIVTALVTLLIFFLGSLQLRLSAQEQCAAENSKHIAVLQQQFSSEMTHVREALEEIKVTLRYKVKKDGF
jgi:hypothetical protein